MKPEIIQSANTKLAMRWLTGRLALLYGALFFELGVNLPFFPVWLRAQALDDAAIGFVLAAPLLVRIVANPWRPRRPTVSVAPGLSWSPVPGSLLQRPHFSDLPALSRRSSPSWS